VTGARSSAGSLRPGDRVRISLVSPAGNPRTPAYALGREVEVIRAHGIVSNPMDHRDAYPPLYTVCFALDPDKGSGADRVYLDVHDDWLEVLDHGPSRQGAESTAPS
jgi:Nitrile hydratase beta subunit